MDNTLELAGVILPDGRIDPDGKRFVNGDVELVPVVLPKVTSNGSYQLFYEYERLQGRGHGEAFACAAYRAASRELSRTPFANGDTICFVSLNPYGRKISDNFDAQVAYWRMRKMGESHNMAEMLATRSFPGVKTDAIFNESKFSGDAGRVSVEEQWLRKQAEDVGVSTNGKWYCRGLASFPGDPTAWVGDRGDVLRIAKEKNFSVHGYVEHKAHETDPGGDVPIDPELIDAEVQDILESNPGARAEDVQEHVYALRTGAIDPNALRVGDYDESVFNEDP